MATYKISPAEGSTYRAEATEEAGFRHVCSGFATEADAEAWIAAHRRNVEAADHYDRVASGISQQ